MLLESIKESILDQINPDSCYEQCGIITNGKAILTPNIHVNPEDDFLISPQLLASYDKIEAIFHTHWSDTHPGYFTISDIQASKQCRLPFILYHTRFKVWDYYDSTTANPFPLNAVFEPKSIESYIGITAKWERSDCFAICRCFYLGMFGIDIGDFPRPQLETFPKPEYYCQWLDSQDKLITLPVGAQLKPYDLLALAMQGGKQANHAAIALSSNEILHAPIIEGMSRKNIYGAYWRNRTVSVRRLKILC